MLGTYVGDVAGLSACLAACVLACGCSEPPATSCDLTVVLSGPEAEAVNVWLEGGRLGEPQMASGDGPEYVFRGVQPGRYLVTLDPDYEDWSSHCVAYTEVELSGGHQTVSMRVPEHGVVVIAKFQTVAAPVLQRHPLEVDGEDLAVARVERLCDGEADPVYRQWLFVEPRGDAWSGELGYLERGVYRITFFTVDYDKPKDSRTIDLCSADVVLDERALKSGTVDLAF